MVQQVSLWCTVEWQLLIFSRETSIWSLWGRPFLTLQYPAVVWGSLTYGVCLGWVVFQQTANAAVFPQIYHFTPQAVGNISVSVSHRCGLFAIFSDEQTESCWCRGWMLGGRPIE